MTAPESKAVLLGEALHELFPTLSTEVIPVSAPVAAMGLAVWFQEDFYVAYVPAIDSWWKLINSETNVSESVLGRDADLDSITALVAFDLALHLLEANLIVGRETSQDGDSFGAAVRHLAAIAESGDTEEAQASASLYLSILNANLEAAAATEVTP